ncbi:MAG: type 4a pilus biogenesis protein PilO [Blastocatellia bacterium]|nr:type 4a pilus biogenesis protein PilO [Blastocatellia bacterium]
MFYLKQLLLALMLFVGGWQAAKSLWMDDWAARIDQRKTQISALKERNQITDRYRAERPILLQQVAQARIDYAKVEAFLPTEPTLGAVVAFIQKDARDLHLMVRNIEEPHPPYVQGINEIPLKLEAQGFYNDQKTLLKGLGLMKQTINIKDWNLERRDDGSAYLSLNLGVLVDLPTKEAVDKANGK